MGVVNATPDSFSDGGLYFNSEAAIARARELIRQGADIVDIGGESTRPGAEPVSHEEELRRAVPVVELLAEWIAASVVPGVGVSGTGASKAGALGTGARISIDTSKASVARAALAAGATIVNDVTALRGDPLMADVVAAAGCECVLMHMLGSPRTMQAGMDGPRYKDVVDDVRAFLVERMAHAVRAGIPEHRIILDPGIGFGKTVAHNLTLLRRLDELVALGRPVLVGTSRKSFIGHLIAESAGAEGESAEVRGESAGARGESAGARGESAGAKGESAGARPVAPEERLPGTIATNVLAYERGASIFRVHDVAPVRAALAVAAATFHPR